MQYNYNPSSEYEKFGVEVYKILSKNFPQTYFVGGLVRDLLLHRQVTDIDITTEATPEEVISALRESSISFREQGKQFGVITAASPLGDVEITTLRTEKYEESRFPKVHFTKSVEDDSTRRDFTVNALYLNLSTNEVLDFHNGLSDLEKKRLKFIGDARERVKEDPLRIIRAYRFEKVLNLEMDDETKQILIDSYSLLKTLSAQRIDDEIDKISDLITRQELRKVIHNFA